MKTQTVQMLISSIRRDGGTQIRAALDEATVAKYAAAIKAGAKLPPPVVYFDGTDNWLSDGFHRVEAELRNGAKRMPAEVRRGTKRDALENALGANEEHGLPRSNADKRRAVEAALADDEWSTWTDNRIAKLAKVSNHLVSEVRASIDDRSRQSWNSPTACAPAQVESLPKKQRKADAGMASGSGDEGGGARRRADGPIDTHGVDPSAPPPDEPRVSIDLLGIDDIDPAWLELICDIEAALGAFDNHLRQAQASVCDLLGRPGLGAQLQALRRDAHELAARARKSVRPHSVCVYCKDPDGTAGRRGECNGCRGLGYVTEEQMGAVPAELKAGGEKAKVIDQKAGGYVPRAPELKVELVDEAGASEPFDDGGF